MLSDDGLDLLFRQARTQNAWLDKPLSETLVRAIYDLTRMGPTSANCCPARFVFCSTPQAKARLAKHVQEGNVKKVETAPVCAIIAYDTKFYDKMPELFPARPQMKDYFAGDAKFAQDTAFRNSSLQGAYFILAARALGVGCGPMSGFNNANLDADFFPDGRFKSNFLCSIGTGDPAAVFPRNPRLSFEDACQIL